MICRACGKYTESAVSLLHPSHRELKTLICQIDDKFESAGLPTSVCQACFGSLSAWSSFTSQSTKAQGILKTIEIKKEIKDIKHHIETKPTALQKWLLTKNQPAISKTIKIESQISKYNIKNCSVRVERLSETLIEKLTNTSNDDDSNFDYHNSFNENIEIESGHFESISCKSNSSSDSFEILQGDRSTSNSGNNSNTCFQLLQESSCKQYEIEQNSKKATIQAFKNQDKKEQIFTCSECKFKTYCRIDLEKHTKKHITNKIKCDHCYDICFDNLQLENHKVMYHSSKHNYKCYTCLKSFKCKKVLQYHTKHHYTPKFSCDTCNKTFLTKTDVLQHLQSVHYLKQSYYCNECPLSYRKKSSLKYHISNVHLKLCDIEFSYPTRDKCFHYKTRTASQIFACEQCEKTFKSFEDVKQHKNTVHVDKNAVVCPKCDKTYKTNARLNIHLKYIHYKNEIVKFHDCEICNRKFHTSNKLQTHKLFVHSNVYKYPCTKCSSKFKTRGHLKRHIQSIHDNSKPFECIRCNKSFKSSYNLKLHGKVHSNKRPFKCSKCTSAFKSKQELKGHFQRMHTNERPYKCKYCNYSFVASSDLAVHVNARHEKLKSYPCDKCSSIFNCASNLRSHKVRWHKIVKLSKKLVIPKVKKTFTCSYCLYTSKFKSNLTRHIFRHHV